MSFLYEKYITIDTIFGAEDITLTLTFIRSMQNPTTMPSSPTSSYSPTIGTLQSVDQVIDTQAPLVLGSSMSLAAPRCVYLTVRRQSHPPSRHPRHPHGAGAEP